MARRNGDPRGHHILLLWGLSTTGITSALACLETVKELGLEKVAIGCLGALPLGVKPVIGKTKAAKKVITVDGCPDIGEGIKNVMEYISGEEVKKAKELIVKTLLEE